MKEGEKTIKRVRYEKLIHEVFDAQALHKYIGKNHSYICLQLACTKRHSCLVRG